MSNVDILLADAIDNLSQIVIASNVESARLDISTSDSNPSAYMQIGVKRLANMLEGSVSTYGVRTPLTVQHSGYLALTNWLISTLQPLVSQAQDLKLLITYEPKNKAQKISGQTACASSSVFPNRVVAYKSVDPEIHVFMTSALDALVDSLVKDEADSGFVSFYSGSTYATICGSRHKNTDEIILYTNDFDMLTGAPPSLQLKGKDAASIKAQSLIYLCHKFANLKQVYGRVERKDNNSNYLPELKGDSSVGLH